VLNIHYFWQDAILEQLVIAGRAALVRVQHAIAKDFVGFRGVKKMGKFVALSNS
jgi:hypothetical protein